MKSILAWLTTLGLLLAQLCQADPLDFWTWRNPYPTGSGIAKLTYVNGQYVGVGGIGTIVTSPDGTNWLQRYSGTSDDFRDIACGNGQVVVVGGRTSFGNNCTPVDSHAVILTSLDGNNWTQRDSPTTNMLLGVAYGNGGFVAIGGWSCSGWSSIDSFWVICEI